MNLSYRSNPIEGQVFHISADDVRGRARFRADINGELFWEDECPDPPCHEQCLIPERIAGSTLLLTVHDDEEQHELTFFINDDGEGIPQRPVVKKFA